MLMVVCIIKLHQSVYYSQYVILRVKNCLGIFFLRLGNFFWIPVWEGFPFIFLYFALDFP